MRPLPHQMAHVATETDDDDDESWILEMERLKVLGAPLLPGVSETVDLKY
jgi:hypothetical protein